MITRAALLLLCATQASAQQRLLERADSLLTAENYEQARSVLAEWERGNPPSAPIEAAQRTRALYLVARLTPEAAKAQEFYLTIALSFPRSREAPDALLRIGQSFLASGDPVRAATYLERLINDYPTASVRSQGYLWLIRAQIAAGKTAEACTAATAALESPSTSTSETASLLAVEQRSACDRSAAATQRTAPLPSPAAAPPPARTDAVRDQPAVKQPGTTSAGRYAVQIAAFRDVGSANAIAAQLRRNGHDARVTYVAGSSLARVRIGRFPTHADALSAVRRLKAVNVDGIVVDDATRERAAR